MILSPVAAWATDAPLVGNASVGSGYPTRKFECLPNLAVGEGNVTLVEFDLSTLPAGLSGPAILKATLTVFVNQVGKPGTLDVAPVQSAWSEPTVTHSTLPGIGLPIGSGVSVNSADEYVSFDVTVQVQDWVAAPNTNFGLALTSPSGLLYIDSKESTATSHPAKLDVTIAGLPANAEFVSFGGGGGGNTWAGFQAFNDPNGTADTAFGALALGSSSGSQDNTAFGDGALQHTTTGSYNTGIGADALRANTTGIYSTAVGANALASNTGSYNDAFGGSALGNNTSGELNVALGFSSLASNSTGSVNTAVGDSAMSANTTGQWNQAFGASALSANTSGHDNTAAGFTALAGNTTGYFNTGVGESTFYQNTTGVFNTAIGSLAGDFNTGSYNTFLGGNAGNTPINNAGNTTGSSNIFVGFGAGGSTTTGSNNIQIGNYGSATDAGVIRIGGVNQSTAFIAGITGVTTGVSDAVDVVIDTNGQLGTINSSLRFKHDIADMGDSSSGLMRLRPVTFHYNQGSADGVQRLEYGLIAEEVAKVYPEAVTYTPAGETQTIQYHKINAMMLNEIQKQHQQIEDQARELNTLRERLETLEKALQAASH
jgi:hypothetical protein